MPVLLTDNIACELGFSIGTQGIFRELVYDDQEDPVTFNMSNTGFPSNTIYVRKPLYALVEINSSQVENSCLVRFSSKDQGEKRLTLFMWLGHNYLSYLPLR
jgi:hypothetical protein